MCNNNKNIQYENTIFTDTIDQYTENIDVEKIMDQYNRLTGKAFQYDEIKKKISDSFDNAKKEKWIDESTGNGLFSFFPFDTQNIQETRYFLLVEKNTSNKTRKRWYGLELMTKTDLSEHIIAKLRNLVEWYTTREGGLYFDDKDANKFYSELGKLALKENWIKLNEELICDKYPTLEYLRNYIGYTVKYLKTIEPEKIQKINGYFYLNSGLLSRDFVQSIIIKGRLEHKTLTVCGAIKLELEYLVDPSAYSENEFEVKNIKNLEPAKYLKGASCYFDSSLKIDINVIHISEHKDRSEKFINYEDVAMEIFKGAKSNSELYAKQNPLSVLPAYYFREKRICFLMPIFVGKDWETMTPTCVLILSQHRDNNGNDYYKGVTIFTLEMAYKAARLLGRVESSWLKNDPVRN